MCCWLSPGLTDDFVSGPIKSKANVDHKVLVDKRAIVDKLMFVDRLTLFTEALYKRCAKLEKSPKTIGYEIAPARHPFFD
jgi:hypothetical protein